MEDAMPLVPSDDEEPVVVNGNVKYVMLDGTKRVWCTVASEVLNDVEGGHAQTDDEKIARYHRNSGRINQAASDKYDAGVQLPIVTSADLA
jgi:hypothetical protein